MPQSADHRGTTVRATVGSETAATRELLSATGGNYLHTGAQKLRESIDAAGG